MQVPLTTTLPKQLVHEIEMYATQHNKKKNQVIEESISTFLQNEKRKNFAQSFKNASLDIEIVAMAEEGLTDYKKQLKKYS